MARCFPGFYGPGLLNGAPEQQNFFREGGFPGIRVADDAEGPPPVDFFLIKTVHNVCLINSWVVLFCNLNATRIRCQRLITALDNEV